MATMHLTLDGPWGTELVSFETPVGFDFDRFVTDDEYAYRVSSHIQHVLGLLSEEVQTIGVVMPSF